MVIPLHDDNPTTSRPYVTVGILIACVAGLPDAAPVAVHGRRAAGGLCLWPGAGGTHRPRDAAGGDRAASRPGPRCFTSMFLHGGFWHLAGNMLYLWVFGNNIEDAMGHARFLVVLPAVRRWRRWSSQVLPNPGSIIPMVGASGAISGVLGAYMLLFPRARVLLGLPLGFLIVQLGRFPAIWVLAAWFAMQLVMGAVAAARSVGRHARLASPSARTSAASSPACCSSQFSNAIRPAVAASLRRCYIPRCIAQVSKSLGLTRRGDCWPS